jgi:hypothetical protein
MYNVWNFDSGILLLSYCYSNLHYRMLEKHYLQSKQQDVNLWKFRPNCYKLWWAWHLIFWQPWIRRNLIKAASNLDWSEHVISCCHKPWETCLWFTKSNSTIISFKVKLTSKNLTSCTRFFIVSLSPGTNSAQLKLGLA